MKNEYAITSAGVAGQRRKRGQPVLDFLDRQVGKWMNKVIEEHPEIIAGMISTPSAADLPRILSGELVIRTKPGKPNVTRRHFRMKDWEAWLLYYNLCQFNGFYITPQHIADETGKSYLTVKQKLRLASQEIRKLNP
jgi:hypothetical protein